MKHSILGFAAALTFASWASAAVLVEWNFNSVTPDTSNSTGSTLPVIDGVEGTPTASLVGGTTASFASGAGSSDPVTVDDTGWNTTAYPSASTANKTAGARFLFSTEGRENIVIEYDLRHSNTSSRYEQFQYTLDGTTWIDGPLFDGNAGDTWFNNRTIDLSSVSAADDNANFGIRIVSAFAPTGTTYVPSNSASTYAGTGTWRFDMVQVFGDVIPEPTTLAALAGMGVLALRRRK
jgi:hypothetical protein